MPTYLKYKYTFFFISISGRIRNIFPTEPDPDPWKKMSDPHPCSTHTGSAFGYSQVLSVKEKYGDKEVTVALTPNGLADSPVGDRQELYH